MSEDPLDAPRSEPASVSAELVRARARSALFGRREEEFPRIGRYAILRRLGSGGMGTVFSGYDEQLDRRVAIKVLWSEAGDNARARAEREAKALARLTHPNVVQVYEVGRHRDGLFIAMEYVDGITLGEWQRAEMRRWQDVIEAYRQAGAGLVAAHAQGLVHRDFKPANVMVSEDGDGRVSVRVLDFGLALAHSTPTVPSSAWESVPAGIGDPHSSRLTATGGVLGTPAYMAPEQFKTAAVGAAADQFSFCVALWEGLYGERPFGGSTIAELFEAVSVSRLREAPRSSDVPARVRDIITRGLSAAPSARWPSMRALLDALAIAPPRRWTRIGGGVAGVAGLGLGAVALQAWMADRAARCSGGEDAMAGVWDDARRTAVREAMLGTGAAHAARVWEDTGSRLDAYVAAWVVMHEDVCAATTLRGEQSQEVMDLRMACLHRGKTKLKAAVDVLADADADVVSEADRVVDALDAIGGCADVASLRAGVDPPRPGDAATVEAVQILRAEAEALRRAGRYGAARDRLSDAEAALGAVEYEPARIDLWLTRGVVLRDLGKYDDATVALRQALDAAGRRRAIDSMSQAARDLLFVVGYRQGRMDEALAEYRALALLLSGSNATIGAARRSVGIVLEQLGKYDEAEAEYRAALELLKGALGPEHPDVADALGSLSITLRLQGRLDEAEEAALKSVELIEAALGPNHPRVAGARQDHATVLHEQGRLDEAESEQRAIVALWLAAVGPTHPGTAQARDNLANTLYSRGKIEEAEAEQRRALAVRQEVLGREHLEVARSRSNLAAVLYEQGKLAESEEQFREAIAVMGEALGPEHPDVAHVHANLAAVLEGQGEDAAAETEYRRSLTLLTTALGPEHPDVAMQHNNLATNLLSRGRPEEAETEVRRALEIWTSALGPDHPLVGRARNNLSAVLQTQGKFEEGEAEARRALVLSQETLGPEHPATARSRFNIARALEDLGKDEEAEAEYRRALQLFTKALGQDHAEVGRANWRLARLLVHRGRGPEALPFAEAAWEHARRDGMPPQARFDVAFVLARALWAAGRDRERARSLVEDALATHRATGGGDDKRTGELLGWLRRHRLP